MKKLILFVFAAIFIFAGTVFAQETADNEIVLSLATIGDILGWDNNAEEVYNFLVQFEDLEISVEQDDEYGKTITAETQTEDVYSIYVF